MSVFEIARPEIAGERIVKIASSFSGVRVGTTVHEALDGLRMIGRPMIAVIDDLDRPIGILVAQDLVDILGKPFGRDLLKRQRVEDIMRNVVTFRYDEHISAVRERAQADIEAEETRYFLLADRSGAFRGCVSSRDLLLHGARQHLRERGIAKSIQSRFVPEYSRFGNDRISTVFCSVMAEGVDGDFYLCRELGAGRWFLCLCDISGKGLSAAIVTAFLSGFFSSADLGAPLVETVARLNNLFLETFKLDRYVTGVFLVACEDDGVFDYCDMGHSLCFVNHDDTIRPLSAEADNPPLGMVFLDTVTVKNLRLARGTTFLAVTDGLTEQENRDGKQFPIASLARALASAGTTQDLVRAKVETLEAFFSFKGDMPQRDDVSFMMLAFEAE